MPNHNATSIFLDPVIPADKLGITNKFKPRTSYGADGISTKLLIKTIDTIISRITRIVNLTFETGIFPTDLKYSNIIPIYKVGDPCSLYNYRPINLLSSISLILEITMYNKIMKFLDANNMLYYVCSEPNIQPSTLYFHLLDHYAEVNTITPSQLTLATSCDLSKAFDTISTDILLRRLNICDIRGSSVTNK